VRKRDKTVCAECGIDTNALRRRLRDQVARAAEKRAAADGRSRSRVAKQRASTRGLTKALRERGFKPRQSLWELDHVVPLIDGGDHGLANLQTLCTPCHKKKTVREAHERAVRRSRERQQQDGDAGSAPPPAAKVKPKVPTADRQPRRERPAAREDADLDALLDAAGRVNDRVERVLEQAPGRGRAEASRAVPIR